MKFFALFILLFSIDRLTKVAALFLFSTPVDLIPDTLSLHLYFNEESFLGAGYSGPMVMLVLLVCLGALFFYAQKRDHYKYLLLGIACIGAGALSNSVDVLRYGAVIDWIEIHELSFFNMSDVFIGVGCVVMLLSLFKKRVV